MNKKISCIFLVIFIFIINITPSFAWGGLHFWDYIASYYAVENKPNLTADNDDLSEGGSENLTFYDGDTYYLIAPYGFTYQSIFNLDSLTNELTLQKTDTDKYSIYRYDYDLDKFECIYSEINTFNIPASWYLVHMSPMTIQLFIDNVRLEYDSDSDRLFYDYEEIERDYFRVCSSMKGFHRSTCELLGASDIAISSILKVDLVSVILIPAFIGFGFILIYKTKGVFR